jgi:hypothetical protein
LSNAQRDGQLLDAAECLNGFLRFHAPIISMLIINVQAF